LLDTSGESVVIVETVTYEGQDVSGTHQARPLRQSVDLLGSLSLPQVEVGIDFKGSVGRIDTGMTIRSVAVELGLGAHQQGGIVSAGGGQ
jgi:hypothetical protein